MRIIAGLAKGRSIDAVSSSTRPTSDRAREALFSTLTSEFGEFEGLRILDLYAGTGAIALEALSRGASVVHAVEKDDSAIRAITSNYENVKSAQCPGSFHLYGMAVHRFLQDKATHTYHFIYIDPPYDVNDIDIVETLIQLRDGGYLDSQTLIAIERNSRVKEIMWPEGFTALRDKNYGQATIFYGVPTLTDVENG
jgi:16S rRNA (guanine966-N2)-methyltransferase